MTNQDYSLSISAPVSASDAYDKIARVSEWWAKDFKGSAGNSGDMFTVRFGETFVDFQITEAVPGRKVVWHVTNCHLPWLTGQDRVERHECRLRGFRRPERDDCDLTHEGLVPEVECFELASRAGTIFRPELQAVPD